MMWYEWVDVTFSVRNCADVCLEDKSGFIFIFLLVSTNPVRRKAKATVKGELCWFKTWLRLYFIKSTVKQNSKKINQLLNLDFFEMQLFWLLWVDSIEIWFSSKIKDDAHICCTVIRDLSNVYKIVACIYLFFIYFLFSNNKNSSIKRWLNRKGWFWLYRGFVDTDNHITNFIFHLSVCVCVCVRMCEGVFVWEIIWHFPCHFQIWCRFLNIVLNLHS